MKFLVISKPIVALALHADIDRVNRQKATIEKLKEDGVIENCYTLVAGGTAYVLNSDSYNSLHQMMRNSNMGTRNEVEIHQISD